MHHIYGRDTHEIGPAVFLQHHHGVFRVQSGFCDFREVFHSTLKLLSDGDSFSGKRGPVDRHDRVSFLVVEFSFALGGSQELYQLLATSSERGLLCRHRRTLVCFLRPMSWKRKFWSPTCPVPLQSPSEVSANGKCTIPVAHFRWAVCPPLLGHPMRQWFLPQPRVGVARVQSIRRNQ